MSDPVTKNKKTKNKAAPQIYTGKPKRPQGSTLSTGLERVRGDNRVSTIIFILVF